MDQAYVLRGLGERLAPRGDNFVIRNCGDSIDAAGIVRARAWCEAVVQLLPGYVDAEDENHIRTADLQSESNRQSGLAINGLSFRWLKTNVLLNDASYRPKPARKWGWIISNFVLLLLNKRRCCTTW